MRARAQWQSFLAEQRKLSGDGTQKTCKNRTARAVPLQIESQSDCHWARALPLQPKNGDYFGTIPKDPGTPEVWQLPLRLLRRNA